MKALSIRQPWAWLIVHGHKDVENRTWKTDFRGKVLIHAGKQTDWGCVSGTKIIGHNIPPPDILEAQCGGIVGVATIIDCVFCDSKSPWFTGPYGFILDFAKPLSFMPCRGRLGFFEVDYKGEL